MKVNIAEGFPEKVWPDGILKIDRESGKGGGTRGRGTRKGGESHKQLKSRKNALTSNMAATGESSVAWTTRGKEDLGRTWGVKVTSMGSGLRRLSRFYTSGLQ